MRYAHGIMFGALLPGIIFMGCAFIKVAGFGITDPAALQAIWNAYLAWFGISIAVIVVPLIIAWFRYREQFREILIYEVGGLAFFSPLWFIFATDVSGDSWVDVLLTGVHNALPFLGPSGSIQGVNIGPIVLIPSIVIALALGLYMLRPAFIESFVSGSATAPALRDLSATVGRPAAAPEEEIPKVPPPELETRTEDELRALLTELGTAPNIIEAIIAAGIKTSTDLVATSPEQLAQITGMTQQDAANLNALVQKKLWFGGI
ncbi:MAG: hypothetical protein DRO73_01980 [Candidatus Thorarchaeota archaeon]|nr:MAG: hypothetical protein DRO73_01980 [Candidatus Thorarchaeota archaeon]